MNADEEMPTPVGLLDGDPFDGDPGLPTVLRAGYQVGNRYTLGEPLGHGGYGSLWTATDDRTGEAVAVKVLQAVEQDEDYAEAAARLYREARAYQKIEHPAVAKLRNVGETDQGEPYLVMELLQGKDLARTLGKTDVVSPTEAVKLMLPIADALAEVHDAGLVHRDVKLSNIFLAQQSDGTLEPKLIDFGLTKQLDAVSASVLTGAGVRIGSPSYMSPEQARGLDVDIRSDVWGFCVVLYRMITGALPFTGKNAVLLRVAIIDGRAATFEERGVNEPVLWEIVYAGLSKKPDERWQSMRTLTRALSSWLAEPSG